MPKKSAGIILYRLIANTPEVLLFHPGGPFWKNKDEGAWSIPKGELNEDEKPLEAALRELYEETGIRITGELMELKPIRQSSNKWVYAWATLQDFDPTQLVSAQVELEWPAATGRRFVFPELDKGAWFDFSQARKKVLAGQIPLLDELEYKILASR